MLCCKAYTQIIKTISNTFVRRNVSNKTVKENVSETQLSPPNLSREPTADENMAGQKLTDQPDIAGVISGMQECKSSHIHGSTNVPPFITTLIRADPYYETRYGFCNTQIKLSANAAYELAAKLLWSALSWSCNIPWFPELDVVEQVNLLRGNWTPLFVLNFSQCGSQIDFPSLIEAADARNGELRETSTEQVRRFQAQVEKLRALRLDEPEYACLKTIVLYSQDKCSAYDTNHVEELQQKCIDYLKEYCENKYPDQPKRFMKLLLRLPGIRSVHSETIHELFLEWMIGKTPIEAVIRDILLTEPPYKI